MAPPEHLSTARIFSSQRGKAPPGRKWAGGVYIPGGDRRNVEPTSVRNPKVAANVQMMYEKWASAKAARMAARAGV
jgi:hypothetical protein